MFRGQSSTGSSRIPGGNLSTNAATPAPSIAQEEKDRFIQYFNNSNAPRFSADIDEEGLDDWVGWFDSMFESTNTPEPIRVEIAQLFLKNRAGRWYRNHRQYHPQVTWSQLKAALYRDLDIVYHMNRWDRRAQRWDQKSGERINVYLQRFETRIIASCPRELTEQEKCIVFWNGLLEIYKPLRNPDTYFDLQEMVRDARTQERQRLTIIGFEIVHIESREGPSAEETRPREM